MREFIEKEIYGYLQTMSYECKMCGDRYEPESGEPYKCECGNKEFERVPEHNSKSGLFGPMMVSFYEKDGELALEFANKNKSSSKIIVKDVLQHLDGLVNTIRRIQKESEKMIDDEEGDFDIDIIESGVSSSQRNRLQTVKVTVDELTGDTGDNVKDAPRIEEVLDEVEEEGVDREKAKDVIEKLKREGELFEPEEDKIHKI